MPSVHVIGGGAQYEAMFLSRGWKLAKEADADLLQFTGGEDVLPYLYGELPHPRTSYNSARDRIEIECFEKGRERGQAIAGICRGSQFLTVMMGGKLWQDVNKHTRANGHKALIVGTDQTIHVSSTHHQMMLPGDKAEVLMIAHESSQREYVSPVTNTVVTVTGPSEDTEATVYRDARVLCFQPHPEFEGYADCREAYFDMLNYIL